MRKLSFVLISILLGVGIAFSVYGGPFVSRSGGGGALNTATVATLPAAPATNTVYVVTDGSTAGDCTVGGGSDKVLCVYNGDAWVAAGDGTGGVGSGSVTTVEVGDAQVGGADIVSLDFNAAAFDVTESPDTEINISLDLTPSSGNATMVLEEDALQVKYDTTDFTEGTAGLLLGASPTITTSLSIGSDPADAGTLRLPNAGSLVWEDATEASITHVDNTGWLINSTHQLQFGDSATYINQATDGHLDINADTSIDLNGPISITDNTATMTHTGTTSLAIVSTSGTVAVEGTTFTGNDLSAAGDITAVGGDVTIAAAGVKLTGATGILTLAGVGGTYNENLTFDMEPATDTNTVDVGTGTGVTTVDFGSINLATDALDLSEGNITNVGDIALDSISADGTNISIVASSGTVTVESVVFTGANLSSVGTVGLTGGITISADEATLTHSGTTSFTVTSTSGTVVIEGTTFNGNNTTIAGDLTITGDDLTMTTNTIGAVLVGDGTNFNPVVMGGDATIGADGALAIAADTIGADEMADADHGMVSWSSGAATVEDFALNTDADVGDNDITSIDKLEGYDTAIYIDMGTDGYIDLEADTGIRFNGPIIFANEGELDLPSSDADPNTTGEIRHDSVVSGVTNGMITWYDGVLVRYIVDLSAAPADDDYVVAYDADADKFYMKVDQSAGAPSFDTVADPEAAVTLSHDDTETITITTAQNTAGSFLIIDNTVADVTNNVYLIEGQYTDDDDANAFFLKFSDNNGAEVEFSVGPQGVVSIGEDPASAGTIRLPNAGVIAWKDGTEATITHVNDVGLAFNLGIDIQAGGITLANDETITNATDGVISFNGKIEMDGTDPHIFFDETDGADWYLGTDDTGDSFEFRTNATIGNSVVFEINENGSGITIGDEGDDDIAVTFRSNGDDGLFTWMEDEQYFKFSDHILMDSGVSTYYRDTAIQIGSGADGYLDLEADTGIRFSGPVTFINEGAITLPTSTNFADTAFTDLDTGASYSNFGAAGDDTLNELFAAIDTAWSALGGDVTGVGNCTEGDCLDGSSDGGTTISLYDGDSHKLTIDAADLTADATIVLGADTNNLLIYNGTARLDLASGVTMDIDVPFYVNGQQVTITGAGQANTVTLNEGFTIGDGYTGTLTYSAESKTLTVATDVTLNQDLQQSASPTFAGATIAVLSGVTSIDAPGADAMVYGSADVTGHTFTSDGGTVVLDGSITATVDANATVVTINANYPDTGAQVGLKITTNDDDDADYDPFQIRDDSGGNDDALFIIDHTGAVTTGIWNAGAVTSSGAITATSGVNLGTSQALVGTTAMTIGNNGQTVAIDSSDWNIDATGAITGVSFDVDGTGNSLANIVNDNIKSSAAIDATKIGAGGVTSTEFGYIGTLTSDVQTQITNILNGTTGFTKATIAEMEYTGATLTIDVIHTAASTLAITNSNVTHVANVTMDGDLTVSGGEITLGTSQIFSGGDTTSLNLIDALDATTEATIEAAMDTLANVTTIGGATANSITVYAGANDQDIILTVDDGGTNKSVTIDGSESTVDFGADNLAMSIKIHDAGIITMYDDGDDTSVVLGPVADGTTTLGITGSLSVSATVSAEQITSTDDMYVEEDEGVLAFGADHDVTLTHVADTGLNMNMSLSVADNKYVTFGGSLSGYDWAATYDETTSDALEFSTTAVGAADADTPMFLIQVDSGGAGMTADQVVFAIATGVTNVMTIDEDGDLTITGGIYTASSDNPSVILNDDTDGDMDAWFGLATDDDETTAGDYFKIATGTTPGSGTDMMTLDVSGNAVFTGTVKGTSIILEGGTYDITIDVDAPTGSSMTYTWPNAAPAASGYALVSTDAGVMSWTAMTASTTGSPGDVQYESAADSTLAGEAAFNYNATNNTLSLIQAASNITLQVWGGSGSWYNTPQVGIMGVTEHQGNIFLDDGVTDSPILYFKDANDETAAFAKTDSGYLTITTIAADGVNIVTGNLKVGNESPTQTINGEDVYIEGLVEVDGIVYLENATEASAVGTAAVILSGGLSVAKDIWAGGGDLVLDADSAVIKLGADQDVTITHVADTGIILASAAPIITLNDSTDAAGTGELVFGSANSRDIVGTIQVDESGTAVTYITLDGVNDKVIIGQATPDDNNVAFAIQGDADSDGAGDTTEALTFTLTGNATPTSSTWAIADTQGAGISLVSTAGTVTVESVVFTGGALTGITALDGVTIGDGGSTNYLTISDTGGVTFAGSATFSAAGATSSIPWKTGTDTATNTTEGTAYWETDTDMLTIGDGSSGISLDLTANTVITFPTSTATLATTGGNLSQFAATTSAELYGVVSDETGSGGGTPLAVFNYNPTLTGFTLAADASLGNYDVTAVDKLQGYDNAVYIDMGADGTMEIAADTVTTITSANIQLRVDAEAYMNVAVGNGAGATISVTSDGVDTLQIGDGTDDQPRVVLINSTTNEHWSGTALTIVSGETVAVGQPVYVKSDGKVWLADADAAATMPAIGLVAVGGNPEASVKIVTHGLVTDTDWAWTVGATIYVADGTAGALTETVGDLSDQNDVVQVVGIAIHADSILVMPSLATVVLAAP